MKARDVIEGGESLGKLLATVSVIKCMTADFRTAYQSFKNCVEMQRSTERLTKFFNMDVDTVHWKRINRLRRHATKDMMTQLWNSCTGLTHHYLSDVMPLGLKSVHLCVGADRDISVLENIDISVRQGCLVSLLGPHGCGKTSLLQLIAHRKFPTFGEIYVPTHLRILFVAADSCMLKRSPYHNLIFGMSDEIEFEPCLLVLLLRTMGLDRVVEMVLPDLWCHPRQPLGVESYWHTPGLKKKVVRATKRDMFGSEKACGKEKVEETHSTEEEAKDLDAQRTRRLVDGVIEDDNWTKQLTTTELSLIHLARGFLTNPELMVMQKPLRNFDIGVRQTILSLMRSHVDDRGFGLPKTSCPYRRPRTVFFSADTFDNTEYIADFIWHLTVGPDNIGNGIYCKPSGRLDISGGELVAIPPPIG